MSSRLPFLGLALLATVLAGVIVLELDAAGPPEEDQTGIVAVRHAPLVRPRTVADNPADHTDTWVEASLARPLFSRDRRPTAVAAKGGSEQVVTSMPRLTGVMVTPLGRSAIFAGQNGGKPVVVAAGGSLGPYVVEAIEPGHVRVNGPEGVVEMQPSFDAAARQAALAEVQQQQQQQLLQQQQQIQQQQIQQQQMLLQQQQQQLLLQQQGQPGVVQPPALNLRPGSQFQRALSAIQANRPPQQRDETQQ